MVDDPSTSIITQHVEKIDNSALLKLAKEQKMNTDVRRSIFVIIIGSEVNIKFNAGFLYLIKTSFR